MLREPVFRKAWSGGPPTVVNAFYIPSKNQISKGEELPIERKFIDEYLGFPAGILQMPFFHKDAPK